MLACCFGNVLTSISCPIYRSHSFIGFKRNWNTSINKTLIKGHLSYDGNYVTAYVHILVKLTAGSVILPRMSIKTGNYATTLLHVSVHQNWTYRANVPDINCIRSLCTVCVYRENVWLYTYVWQLFPLYAFHWWGMKLKSVYKKLFLLLGFYTVELA